MINSHSAIVKGGGGLGWLQYVHRECVAGVYMLDNSQWPDNNSAKSEKISYALFLKNQTRYIWQL